MESCRNSAYLAHAKKALRVVLSTCLVSTSCNLVDAIQPGAERPTQYELAPPPSLGWVVDAYMSEGAGERGSVGERPAGNPLVVLIQDLHAHYGVQKNI